MSYKHYTIGVQPEPVRRPVRASDIGPGFFGHSSRCLSDEDFDRLFDLWFAGSESHEKLAEELNRLGCTVLDNETTTTEQDNGSF